MLGFLVFLLWSAIFVLPLAVKAVKLIRRSENFRENAPGLFFASVWLLAGVGIYSIFSLSLEKFVEYLWFEEVGYTNRFWALFKTRAWLFLAGWLSVTVFFSGNVFWYVRSMGKCLGDTGVWVKRIGVVISLAIGLFFGEFAVSNWNEVLLYANQVDFGKQDPVFGKDVAFYVFTLPALHFFVDFLFLMMLITLVVMAVAYMAARSQVGTFDQYNNRIRNESTRIEREDILLRGITHVSALGIGLMVLAGFWTWLARYGVMYSKLGKVYGAGWTDINWQIPMYWVFVLVLIVSTVSLAASVLSRSLKMTKWAAVAGFSSSVLFWIFGVVLLPVVVQRYYVGPNELAFETPYLRHNIEFTREAYGLSDVVHSDFPVKDGITSDNLTNDVETLESARLWDWQVLIATNSQNQVFRPYYTFRDVDVVRYDINNRKVQLMYSSRELDVNRLAESAKTWQNQHIVYTHGFGGTANPVNSFTAEGLPNYWVKDVPPVSQYPELEIKQPRIYFGEVTTDHVYVKTKMKEFDYAREGEGNEWFFYDGPGGITLGGGLRKFAFAWRFDGIRMLISSELTPESRIMFNRDINTRISAIAPFLEWDDDKYQIIADGQLWFMCDGYTSSRTYPYSEPISGGVNYIRNSVKAVVNAYTGRVDFYVFDDNDPIIKAYSKAFPGMFKPASEMPASLRRHVRYPEDLMTIQGQVYSNYHMNDPGIFYNKEDAWQFANQFSPSISKPEVVTPYYAVMALPGNHEREYVVILPFTPLSTDPEHPRNNMVAWFAGRSDGDHYGELILYRFPRNRQINGPLQVGMRINQDDMISKDLSLWNQQGSRVILGDLRVLPLSDSRLLYVQPLYLQSEGGKMPEIKRIFASSGNELVYTSSFSEALDRLVGSHITAAAPETVQMPNTQRVEPANSSQSILEHLDRYLRLLQEGKFAEAGTELESLKTQRNNNK